MNLADSGAVMAGSEQQVVQGKYISLTAPLTMMCRVDTSGKELGRGE